VRTRDEQPSTLLKVSASYSPANYHQSIVAPSAHHASAVRKIADKVIGRTTKHRCSTTKKNVPRAVHPFPPTMKQSRTRHKSAHLPSAYEVPLKHLDHEGRDKTSLVFLLYYSFTPWLMDHTHTIPPLSLAFSFCSRSTLWRRKDADARNNKVYRVWAKDDY
jgi:hypothetical protein